MIFAASQVAFAACGYRGVTVSGSASEIADTCRALSEILAYFQRLGFEIRPVVGVSFKRSVWLNPEGPANKKVRVSGLFDAKRGTIVVTSWNSDLRSKRRPWGIPWRAPIAHSVLQHEFVHLAVAEIAGQGLGRTWREFIAYAVEFELMDRNLRARILKNYPHVEAFESPENVNPFIYSFDPDAFGLRAYLYTRTHGGPAFIRRLLTGNVSFRTETNEYFWPMR